MNNRKMIEEIADLLEMEVEGIDIEAELENIKNWDSLTVISMIAIIDQYTGVILKFNELEQCKSISDILSVVDSRCMIKEQ